MNHLHQYTIKIESNVTDPKAEALNGEIAKSMKWLMGDLAKKGYKVTWVLNNGAMGNCRPSQYRKALDFYNQNWQ